MKTKKMTAGELIESLELYPKDEEVYFLKGKQFFPIKEVYGYSGKPVVYPHHKGSEIVLISLDDLDKITWDYIKNNCGINQEKAILQFRNYIFANYLK